MVETTLRKAELYVRYRTQRLFVLVGFWLLGRLLEAASRVDVGVRRELAAFDEGFTIALSVLGERLSMRVRVAGDRFVRAAPSVPADVDIVFKHLTHAFHALALVESSALAFAQARTVTRGDTAHAIRFVRCMNRVQAVLLPLSLVRRLLKPPLPSFARGERLMLMAALWARFVRGLFAVAHGAPRMTDPAGVSAARVVRSGVEHAAR
jgi:hypothetical protein